MVAILCVGAGGCLGAIGRYLIGLAPFDGSFPLTTFFVNFMGAVAIGALTEASLGTAGMPREAELFFKTGRCGRLRHDVLHVFAGDVRAVRERRLRDRKPVCRRQPGRLRSGRRAGDGSSRAASTQPIILLNSTLFVSSQLSTVPVSKPSAGSMTSAYISSSREHRVQRVRQLDLPAHAGLHVGQKLHHARRQQVAAEHGQVRRRILERRLLHERVHLPHVVGHRGAGDDAEAAHLVVGHRHDGDDARAAVGVGHLLHARQHLVVRHQHVAKQHVERLAGRLLGGAVHGMAQAERLVLVHVADVGGSPPAPRGRHRRPCRGRAAWPPALGSARSDPRWPSSRGC